MVKKITKNSQSIAADVNELLFGYYLTNSWKDFEDYGHVKTEYAGRSKKITVDELTDQEGRAKEQAKKLLEWMKDNGIDIKIVKKWWPKQNSKMISEAVGYPVDLDKNPIDLLIKNSKDEFLGISAKSGKGKGKIPFKNRGLGSVQKELGIDLESIYDLQIKKLLKKYSHLPVVQKERKTWFKKNTEFYKKEISNSKFVSDVFSGIRDAIFNKLCTFTKEELWNYIRDYWIDAGDLKPRCIRIIGRGVSGKYSAEIEELIMTNPQNLRLERAGFDKIRIHYGENSKLDMRVKFESTQMASSIKFSGE